MKKIFLTAAQAESVLPDSEVIHTFLNPGFELLGADWSREDLLTKLQSAQRIEICGSNAKNLGHGICTYNENDSYSDVLFIETDMEQLEQLERELTEGQ